MNKDERISMIIEYAKKVLRYPVGSKGYDPVDPLNLAEAIQKYEDEEAQRHNDNFQTEQKPKTTNIIIAGEINDYNDFKKLVEGMEVDKNYDMPATFRYSKIRISTQRSSDNFDGYSWSMAYNWAVVRMAGNVYPMKNTTIVKTFKTLAGAKKSLINYCEYMFED